MQYLEILTAWQSKQYNQPVLRLLAWLGSLGMGLTVFFVLADLFRFEYHLFKDVVATPAFELYPEQQDWWLYILSMIVIPLLTFVGYAIWIVLTALLNRLQVHAVQRDLVFITATYVLWWVCPLAYVYPAHQGALPTYVAVGLFFAVNGCFIAYRWLESRSSLIFPSWSEQGIVLFLGGVVAVYVLVLPIKSSLLDYPLRILFGTILGFWAGWLGASFTLSRLLQRGWRAVATALSFGFCPVSVLPLQCLLWWGGYQDGKRVVEYHPWWDWILPVVVLIAVVGLTIWALRRLLNGDVKLCQQGLRRWVFLLTVPILLYALAYRPNIHGPLDLFHDGEHVASAQALLAGQIPYKDVVFVHGFLRDPGVALAAYRLFGTSVAGWRTLEQLLAPLALVATYYLAMVCLGNWHAVLYAMLALTGFWPLYDDWRIISLSGALMGLVLYARRHHVTWAVCGSICTAVAFLTSFDMGLIALSVGAVFSIVYSIAHWHRVRATLLLGYWIPLFLAVVGVGLVLGLLGALPHALRWHQQLLAVCRDWNGMPFPSPPQSLSKLWESWFSPAVSLLTMVLLTLSVWKRKWKTQHWVVLMLLLANLMLFNRGLVNGSIYFSALITASHFAPLLFIALFLAGSAPVSLERPVRHWGVFLCGLALLLPSPVHLGGGQSILHKLSVLPSKHRIEIPSSWVQSSVERIGPIFLPPDQARSTQEITEFLAQVDSFWDFSDHGALFFLSDHTSPTRFYSAHHVITGENQREVIRAFEKAPPRYVVFRSNTHWDAIAGVDRTIRSFLVSEYLLKHYHVLDRIGGFTVLERGALSLPTPLEFSTDLGYIPLLWGRDRFPELTSLRTIVVKDWTCSLAERMNEWRPAYDISLSEFPKDGTMLSSGEDAQLHCSELALDPRSVTYLQLDMRLAGNAQPEAQAQLFWRADEESFSEGRSVVFDVPLDNQSHTYLIRLISLPSWAWSGQIVELRLDPVDQAGIEINIDSIKVFQVDEIQDPI